MNGDNGDRRAALVRVLMENIGGLLAFIGVIASGGMILERLGTQGKVIDEARAEQKTISRDIDGIRDSVSEIKGKIAVHDAEINHLKGRHHVRHYR